MSFNSKKNKLVLILAHLLAWVLLLSIPVLLKPNIENNELRIVDKELLRLRNTVGIITFIIFWISIFYFNAIVLIPKLLRKKKIVLYIASIFATFALLFFTDQFLNYIFFKVFFYKLNNFLFVNSYPIIFVLVVSSAYRIILDKVKLDRESIDKMNENLKTEISLLRSQVSPHFMFNVLNNMVALARKKSDLLEDSLIKLSQLLRYMLYETQHRVTMAKEIEYLQNYILLQQQRFGNTVKVNTSFDTKNDHLEIEPMLLIPFVENAFKHGTTLIENPVIDIALKYKENQIVFTVKNQYNKNTSEVKDATSGIGLENVKRRLQLLYPSSHTLQIDKKDAYFEVCLKINLQ